MIKEEAFNLFVSSDTLRTAWQKPFEINGNVYSTDGHSMIFCEKDICDFTINNPHTPPNCESIIPKPNIHRIVDLQKSDFDVFKTEDELMFTGEDIECKTCDGHGEVEWEFQSYTMDADCPVCDGSGFDEVKKSIKTGNKTFSRFYVNVLDVLVDFKYFNRLIKVSELLDSPIELIHLSDLRKGVLFRIGQVKVLLMPCTSGDPQYQLKFK